MDLFIERLQSRDLDWTEQIHINSTTGSSRFVPQGRVLNCVEETRTRQLSTLWIKRICQSAFEKDSARLETSGHCFFWRLKGFSGTNGVTVEALFEFAENVALARSFCHNEGH